MIEYAGARWLQKLVIQSESFYSTPFFLLSSCTIGTIPVSYAAHVRESLLARRTANTQTLQVGVSP